METLTEDIENLVLAAQNGDREAFGHIAKIYGPMLTRYARQLVWNSDDADELVQEALLRAMKKLGQLREAVRLPAWLRTITARLAINRGLRKQPTTTMEEQALEVCLTGGPATPIDLLLRGEEEQIVREAVDKLRPIDREVVRAFYFEHKSIEQIVDELKIPEGTAKRRLHVGRNRLREMIEGATDRRATLRRLLAGPAERNARSRTSLSRTKAKAGRRARLNTSAQARRCQLVGSG